MKQPLFPSTIGTQSRFAYFLTVKAVVRKFGKSDGQTGSWCLDKAVLAQGGGGGNCTKWKRHGWVGSQGPLVHVDPWEDLWLRGQACRGTWLWSVQWVPSHQTCHWRLAGKRVLSTGSALY